MKICSGGKPNFGKIKLRKDEIINVSPKLNLSSNILNWKAKTDLDEALAFTADWYLNKNKADPTQYSQQHIIR